MNTGQDHIMYLMAVYLLASSLHCFWTSRLIPDFILIHVLRENMKKIQSQHIEASHYLPSFQGCDSSYIQKRAVPTIANLLAYGEGPSAVVQTTWAPDPVVHHFCAHVATLTNKQAVLYLLLGAIIVWEGSTTAERRCWG